MTLTAAGVLLSTHARQVIDAERRAAAAVADFSNAVKLIRIGSMESTLASRLPPMIAEFRQSHPNVQLEIQSGTTQDLVSCVLDGALDIALIGGRYSHPDLTSQIVFSEEMVLISDRRMDSVESAREQPLIVFKTGCSYREYSNSWMKKNGLAPNRIIELGTLDGILGCVASGVGVTLLPRSVAEISTHLPNLNIHPIEDEQRFIDTCAIQNNGAPQNGAASALLGILTAAH